MGTEKVSVIIPVYKAEPYLRRCLDSVLCQTYQNLEIILVDDGSPDNSGAICDEYAAKDDRILVIHQENKGVSAARNTALHIATGEYIVFIDSDDSVLSTYVMNLMSAGQYDYVVSGCSVQNATEEWSVWDNIPQLTTLKQIKEHPENINRIPTGMVWAHRYKRSIITNHSLLFRRDISRGEDTLFNCLYLSYCDTIAVLNAPDYRYHYIKTSATSILNTNLFQWSMESVLAIGQIIGTDKQVFYERVWENAIAVCNNYFHTSHNGSFLEKLQMFLGVFEICRNRYVRKSLSTAPKAKSYKAAFLMRSYMYPFYLLVKSLICSHQ